MTSVGSTGAGSVGVTVDGLTIEQVDAFDDVAFEEAHAAYERADRAGREDVATPYRLEEMRVDVQQPSSRLTSSVWAGRVGGEVVVTGWMVLPQRDNLERADVEVHTVPEARGRGYAAAMLAHLEGVARADGRTVIGVEAPWPHRLGPTGEGAVGPEMLRRRGYELALVDVLRVLELPVDEELLARLAADAAPHHAAYELRSWRGPVPDELVAGWRALSASLDTEAPTGGLDIEPEDPDPALVRETEAQLAAQGRERYHTVALAPDGSVAAFTELITSVHEPEIVFQWGTLVRRADRGHRLGQALKVANLRLLQAERPDLRRVVTWNAESNRHMVAVNEALGFTPAERMGEFQKRL